MEQRHIRRDGGDRHDRVARAVDQRVVDHAPVGPEAYDVRPRDAAQRQEGRALFGRLQDNSLNIFTLLLQIHLTTKAGRLLIEYSS